MQKPKVYKSLIPLSYLYGLGVKIRNKLFDYNILHSKTYKVPIICVGNISVGGTGKTPHTEYLIRLLKHEFMVFVLSRGYKRKSKGFILANKREQITIEEIGDEPFQMWKKFPEVNIAVDADRCNGIENILKTINQENECSKPTVIILDDAYQHRYVKAGLYILLIDYNRPIHNDALLPAGRLREPESGKNRADIVIVSKCPHDISNDEQKQFIEAINPNSNQSVFFTYIAYDSIRGLFNGNKELKPSNDTHILLLTGIASPKTLIDRLKEYTQHIYPLTYSDHHNFDKNDMEQIKERFLKLPEDNRIIITTEKDAARLNNHPFLSNELKPYIYVIPIKVEFVGNNGNIFNKKITEYVRKNSTNSCLLKG